jgi:hypothetical protein
MKMKALRSTFHVVIFGFILAFSIGTTSGQNGIFSPPPPQDSINEADTIIQRNSFLTLFEGKPGKAALYGLLIPGGGQIYNRKWWKVPLALGIDGGLTYVLIYNTTNYQSAQKEYVLALTNPGTGDVPRLKAKRDFYRKWREYSWVWLLAGHLLTVADAYVDRHLLGFDVSPDLSINEQKFPFHQSFTAGLSIKIPISGIHSGKQHQTAGIMR